MLARMASLAASTLLLAALCRSGAWRWNYALVALAAWAMGAYAADLAWPRAWEAAWCVVAVEAWLVAVAGLEVGSRVFPHRPRAWARSKRRALAAVGATIAAGAVAMRAPEVEHWGYRGLLVILAAALACVGAIRASFQLERAVTERFDRVALGAWSAWLAVQCTYIAAWELSPAAARGAGRAASVAFVAAALATAEATGAFEPTARRRETGA